MPHDIDILIEDDRWAHAGVMTLAETALTAVLDDRQLGPTCISLLACDDARIATLNAQFREKPTPTNVLSWPDDDLGPDADGADPHPPQPGPDGTLSLGDIAIAYATCAREAAEQGKPLAENEVKVYVADLWTKTLQTDKAGMVSFDTPWKDTKYIVEITTNEMKPGTFRGEDYQFIWHCVTHAINP